MRPAAGQAAKLLFDGRQQLGLDGVAVGTEVGGVDRIRVVIKRVGMLDLDHQDAGKARADPLLVLVVRLLLLDAVVTRQVEALRVVRLEVGIGWGGAKVVHAVHKVVVKDGDGEVGVGVFVETLRHQDDGGEIHRCAPEPGQQLALDPDVANVLGVRLRGNGRDGFAEPDSKSGMTVDVDLDRLGIEIARSEIPVLAFAAVRRQLHRSAIGAVEGLVDVEHGLHVVVARGHVVERADRVAGGLAGDGDRLTGGQCIDGGAEDHLRARAVIDLHPRLLGGVGREQQQYPAVERLGRDAGGEADGDLGREVRACSHECSEQ